MTSQTSLSALSITICLVTLLSSCGGGGETTATTPPLPTATTVQGFLDNAVSQGIDGIFVHLEQQQQTNTSYASGTQDRITGAMADPASLFKIASNSKLFIAVTTAKLAYLNVISLDDTLAYWLPEYTSRIENAGTITIRYIIQHRSGIPDFDSQTGFSWTQALISN